MDEKSVGRTATPELWENNVIDVQVEDARRLAAIQMSVTSKYAGKPKDIMIWSQMRDELVTRIAEAGFAAKVHLRSNDSGEWIPMVDIIGHVDSRVQYVRNSEGEDLEHKSWSSKRITSSQLEKEGVNTGLL